MSKMLIAIGARDAADARARGGLRVDVETGVVTRNGEPVELTTRERELLQYLAEHAGDVVSRDELLDAVWGIHALTLTRTVDVHVAKLRRKLGDAARRPRIIVTVYGGGYKFVG
jgi:DNA-binding response OmpR family regulator